MTVFGSTARRAQRVVVKVLSRRHWPSKGSGLRKHINYLARTNASRDGRHGVFYSAESDALTAADARAVVRQWEHDRHHFRIVISAEHGRQIHDLHDYVRDVLRRLEQDLQTKLQWMGIDHYNTDNPHSHVLVRGVNERGRVLEVRQDYIAHGMRQRAAESATDLLGERTAQEVRNAKVAEVRAERFTSLDRLIERASEDSRYDAAPGARVGFAPEDRDLLIGRLQFLEALGLAGKGRGTTWHLDRHWRRRLMELGARNDIIKQLYSTLGNEAGRVRAVDWRAVADRPVTGVLVAKGPVDEISDLRFVAVRDQSGALHHARVPDGSSYRSIQIGDPVEVGWAAWQRRRTAAAASDIASAHSGIYYATDHARVLRERHSRWSEEAVLTSVQAHIRQLERWAGREGSGVTRSAEGGYRIDAPKLNRHLDQVDSAGVTDVRRGGARGRTAAQSREPSCQEVDR